MKNGKLGILAAIVLAAAAMPAHALVITQTDPDAAWAKAFWTAPVEKDGHIEVGLTKEFYSASMVDSPLVLQFRLQAADTDKEIWIVNYADSSNLNEKVVNNTSVGWNGYQFRLANSPTFMPTYCNALFVDPQNVVSDVFGLPVAAGNNAAGHYGYIDYNGAIVPNDSIVNFSGIRISHDSVTNGVFYLKQMPVPEPASMILLVVGGAVLTRWRRRKA